VHGTAPGSRPKTGFGDSGVESSSCISRVTSKESNLHMLAGRQVGRNSGFPILPPVLDR
jgi:hypothetical protein